jgi:HD superfamily phosphodiesterase
MNSSETLIQMIEYAKGNRRDINHLMKVYAYVRTIGICEGLTSQEQTVVELAAILHDIACPLCRQKYGSTKGEYQESEGAVLAAEFLKDTDWPKEITERVVYLVGHHHTLHDIDGIDYQILIEADYLVNADEAGYSEENIRNIMEHVFRTHTGKTLLQTVFGIK